MTISKIRSIFGERRQWLAALPERLLAVPGSSLTPRFSRPGGLLLLILFSLLSMAALSMIFVQTVQSELRSQASQRLERIDQLTQIALNDLDSVGRLVPVACDGSTHETLTRASMSSAVVGRFHWLADSSAEVCSPFRSIGDPVAVELTKFVGAPRNAGRLTSLLVTPTQTADMLVVRRVGDSGYLAGQIYGLLVHNYLSANGDDGFARVQLRRFDGTVLHDTAAYERQSENARQSELGSQLKLVSPGGDWFSQSLDSDQHPVTVQVWAGSQILLGRGLRYTGAALMLALLLTAFTIAQINMALAQRASVERRLRIALRKRQFEPVIQPIVDASSGRCLGGEVLMRWRHPARGLLSPFEFLAVAEETGMIDEMTALIMTKARDQLSGILLTHPELYFSFNVTVGQLRAPDFADWLDKVFDLHSIAASNIVIELVERDAVDAQARETLNELRRRGYRIAIDDFGTGQSSLALLPEIGFDTLKIDREFVRSIDEESVNRPVLTAIIELARQLGVSSVAEGVETVAQLEFLIGEGVDAIQGFLIARPMPVAHFAQWLYAHEHKPAYGREDAQATGDAKEPGARSVPSLSTSSEPAVPHPLIEI